MNFKNILEKFTDRHNAGFWVILMIVSIMGMADIPPANNLKAALPLWMKWTGVCFIAAFKATLLIGIYNYCKSHIATKIIFILICSVYIILCVVNFFCLHFYEMGVSNKMFMLIAETNHSEAYEFLSTSFDKIKNVFSWNLLILTIGIVILYFIIKYIPQRYYSIIVSSSSLIGLASFCILVMDTFHGKNYYSIFARTSMSAISTYREAAELNSLISQLPQYENADKVTSSNDIFNLVVIYGESADRDHLSAYGYPLPTSPYMDSISDRLYIFSDVISAAKLTKESMEHMLTLKKDSDSGNWWTYPIIIDILKAAGYKTYWISNQERTGLLSNSIGAITSRADISKYVGKISNSESILQKYDEVLIPELENALTDTVSPKWIGLHLMGSHFAYENRYPSSHSHFHASDVEKANPRSWMGKKQYAVEAQYDNSIRYTDSIVGKMINILEKQQKPSVLIYLSDHGENVYNDRDYCGRDLTSVRIPFIIYTNDAFRLNNPDLTEALENSKARKISSANLAYALMSLTGTECPEYDARYDFLSPQYIEKERYVAGQPWQYEHK